MKGELLQSLQADLRAWAAAREIDMSALSRIRDMLSAMAQGQRRLRHADQRPLIYMPELTARAWWDPADFAWTSAVAAHADDIVRECVDARNGSRLRDHPEAELVMAGNWDILPLFTFGRRHEDSCRLVPRTVRVIETIPTATEASLVYLSSLAPKTRVRAHCGPTNCRLRCHVGVSVPLDCGIRVGSEERRWETGRCIVFDDSFEHEVRNDSDQRRDVLIIDFWHPELAAVERSALQYLTKWLADRNIIDER